MKSLQTKKRGGMALILLLVFLVCGSITTALVYKQMLPDIWEQMAWERGEGYGSGGRDWTPFTKSWTAKLEPGGELVVELGAAYVDVVSYEGEDIQLSFDGQLRHGKSATISVETQGNQVLVREQNQRWGFWDTGNVEMRGTLRVEIPEDLMLALKIDLLSGGIKLKGYEAENLSLHSSSGAIEVEDVYSEKEIDLVSFSGNVSAQGLVAQDACTLESTSGKIIAEDIQALRFSCNSFSGKIELHNLDINSEATVSTDSGKVELGQIKAQSLSVEGFSAGVYLADSQIEELASFDLSSGAATFSNLVAGECEVATFSGEIEAEKLTCDRIQADTTSGGVAVSLERGANLAINTFSGTVQVKAPEDYQFTAEIESFSGKVTVDYPVKLNGESGKTSLRGTVGDGEYHVNIETSSGSVSIQAEE